MQSSEAGNHIFIRLFPDEDIYRELREACEKHHVTTAVIVSGIGQLKQFELGYFKEKGDYVPETFEKPHELLSLTGNVSKQEGEHYFHIHAVLGNEAKKVVGGHLIKGKVEVTNEIVLMKTSVPVHRRHEESTGLNGMFLDE